MSVKIRVIAIVLLDTIGAWIIQKKQVNWLLKSGSFQRCYSPMNLQFSGLASVVLNVPLQICTFANNPWQNIKKSPD